MSVWISKFDINIINIDNIFKDTNKMVGLYLVNQGLPLSFDFSDRYNKAIYYHYFLNNICEFIRLNQCNSKIVFYNNTLSKDIFRNSIIKKIKKIFGFKIHNGVWDYLEFVKMIKSNDLQIIDDFELFIQKETKPKTFKHIKKYLEKEGFKALTDTYFKDIAYKMLVCG